LVRLLWGQVKNALFMDYAPLYVTGHSLGGALAMLAAYDISVNFDLPHPIQVSHGLPWGVCLAGVLRTVDLVLSFLVSLLRWCG
jgi:acetyl esterase/lipase